MRPHNFYANMPPGRPPHHFPNQMSHQGFPQRPLPQMPPNFRPPNANASKGPGPNINASAGAGPNVNAPTGATPKGTSSKIDSFMDTANRFLATAQGFQPIIQQASPMLRNLPALWRLYKGFQSAPDPSNEPEPKPVERRQRSQSTYTERPSRNTDSTPPQPTRPSVPRIFQPPYDF